MQNNKVSGLKENWQQFTLLVVVNAFVGAMIGMERSIFPKFADEVFGITSTTAIFTFIIAFGISKAISNYFAGRLANKFGRKKLLVLGWLIAIPVPFLLIYANAWSVVIFANVLLGVSQGFAWSSTVVMKIDLVGSKQRGLAMGLNEFAGYFAVGLMALITSSVAENYGITPYPFYLGIGISIVGILLSIFFVKDTRAFVLQEEKDNKNEDLSNVFMQTSFKNKSLSAITQAGLVNNLNDGMLWGILPIILLALNFNLERIGIIAAIYPAVWGIGQLFTGKMADHYSKKSMLFWGMMIQAIAILLIPFTENFYIIAVISGILGFGTALVYPTFMVAISQITSPNQRAESIGVFRLWRDMGYAIGAILTGVIADLIGGYSPVIFVGGITFISAIVIKVRMQETD